MKILEVFEKLIHILETAYESFKSMLIAFAKSIGIGGPTEASKSKGSFFRNISQIQMQNIVFTSFVVVFLLAVFSNGVDVTSVQHDQGFNSSSHPVKDIPPGTKLCSNCNGTGIINETFIVEENVTCNCGAVIKAVDTVEMTVIHQSTVDTYQEPYDGDQATEKNPVDVYCTICQGKGWYINPVTEYREVDCPICGGKGYLPS